MNNTTSLPLYTGNIRGVRRYKVGSGVLGDGDVDGAVAAGIHMDPYRRGNQLKNVYILLCGVEAAIQIKLATVITKTLRIFDGSLTVTQHSVAEYNQTADCVVVV